jgi:hypothetical protein
MGSERAAAGRSLTGKQREWLRHLEARHRSGSRVKDYAAEHGIPVQSLYQAAKRLRARGVLAPSGRRTATPRGFVKVAMAPPSADLRSAWRIRLPGGTVFESTTPLSGEQLVTLLERLARAR